MSDDDKKPEPEETPEEVKPLDPDAPEQRVGVGKLPPRPGGGD